MIMLRCAIDGIDYPAKEMLPIDGGRFVNKKYQHKLKRCNICRCYMIDEGANHVCIDCENKVYTNRINPYSTKPRPIFQNFGKDTNKAIGNRYYGIEIELNNTSPDMVYAIGKDLYGEKLLYNKSDSSIGNGVEVVTSPMDKRSLKSLLDRMKNIFEYVQTSCPRYTDNAGIHIHVSKNTIDMIDRYKLCMLLNTKQTNQETYMMYYLSGRTRTTTDLKSNFRFCKIGKYNQLNALASGHDVALNTGNSNTYEFRIFKTTTDKEIILSYVEMVDKMIEFCHCHGISDIRISTFIRWLKNNTTNKILLKKILTFEKRHGKFMELKSVYNEIDFIKELKGIKWKDYDRLIGYIKGLETYRKAYANIQSFKNHEPQLELGSFFGGSSCTDKLCEKLEDTYRKCAISLIRKDIRKEGNKCA